MASGGFAFSRCGALRSHRASATSQWRDGWPLMGTSTARFTRQPVLQHRKPNLPDSRIVAPVTSDEFTTSKLGLQWQWHANHRDEWFSLATRDGWLRLFANPQPMIWRSCRIFAAKNFPRAVYGGNVFGLCAHAGGAGSGLVIMGNSSAALALRATGLGAQMVLFAWTGMIRSSVNRCAAG